MLLYYLCPGAEGGQEGESKPPPNTHTDTQKQVPLLHKDQGFRCFHSVNCIRASKKTEREALGVFIGVAPPTSKYLT